MECLDAPGPLPAPCWARLATDELSSCGSPTHPFNGKIENPSWYRSVLTSEQCAELHCGRRESSFARWIFEYALHGTTIHAEGAPAGELINGGDRGVTSHGWSGASDTFNEVPEQYAAVYFHDDDMVDAGWDYDLEFALPTDISSGLYALRLEAEDAVDRYPFFVRALRDSRADVLLLFPTNTYLAYANDRFMQADLSPIMAHERIVAADEQYLNDHAEFGRSAYDVHSDGSPVRYSSRRRPPVNVRPHYPNWLTGSFRHFAVDLFLIEWLERSGFSYHVATDEDLHQEGKALLERQAVVVTGSHPEYWTGPALNALEQYLRNRGRLMYLGGDGFYWVTTHHRDRPWTIEVRRDNGGLRSWDAPPGERTHVATGEPGGLWRYRGRGPNTICGIGFATEGFSRAQGYQRSEYSRRYPGDLFFEGIDADVVGEAGYILGGAAGDECDRFDLAHGSPPQTQILASATGFGPEYLVVTEDNLLPMPHQDGPHRPDRVRSDMVFVPVDGGGGVFSVGSIAFAGAMAWNGFDNDCCRLADNVLRSFVHGSFIADV
jgi:N,N-dimethylformamidase